MPGGVLQLDAQAVRHDLVSGLPGADAGAGAPDVGLLAARRVALRRAGADRIAAHRGEDAGLAGGEELSEGHRVLREARRRR